MPSRASRGARRARLDYSAHPVRRRRSRAYPLWLYGSFALGLLILLACFLANVPLGQGYFILRYSPIVEFRLYRTLMVLPVGAAACGAVWALSHPGRRSYHVVGLGLLAAAMLGFGAWAWWAPPSAITRRSRRSCAVSRNVACT
jgi:hypothetical protein